MRWKEIRAGHIIFCEGYRAAANPWFSWLPFPPAKGEILQIVPFGPIDPAEHIINAGHWLVPGHDGNWKFGSTTEWEFEDNDPTGEGGTCLEQAFHELFPGQHLEIVRHIAGVRPATRDREPFLGTHPEQPRLHIFNGFGSKGSLLIPRHLQAFVDYLTNGSPIPAHADISRYAP